MAVPKTLRYQVLRRDGFRCRYCGATPEQTELTVDHVIPTALGGADEPSNLLTACRPCNSGKAASNPDAPLVDQVAEDALRWSQAMQWAADIQASERAQRNDYLSAFASEWNQWHFGDDLAWIPDDWPRSIARFFELGLEFAVLKELIETAMRAGIPERKTFAYLCACCWNVIKERQEIARQELLRMEEG